MPAKYWRWGVPCALVIHCLFAGLAIRQRPGLNNDEALYSLGSAQMRISADELVLPHAPATWVGISTLPLPPIPLLSPVPSMTYPFIPSSASFPPPPTF